MAQRGEVFKRGSWKYRHYVNENGRRARRTVGGFANRDEALVALEAALRYDRLGELATVVYPEKLTLGQLVDEYVAQHQAEPSTLRTLRHRLGYAKTAFGDVEIRRINPRELRAWRARLPAGSRRGIHQALRQCLDYAVAVKLLHDNPAKALPNPDQRREEIRPFAWPDETALIADEIDQRWAALPVFVAGTGLRPEEWIALERGDVDRKTRVVHVRRTFYDGRLKEYAKTDRSRRRVPLRKAVIDAVDQATTRIDSGLLFPGPNGRHINLANWRRRYWTPALEAAGFYGCPVCETTMKLAEGKRSTYRCETCGREEPTRRIYDLRHSFAAYSIAAGVSLYYLARFMGTSVQMIDRTYGHLVPDSEEHIRGLLDAYDVEAGRKVGAEGAPAQ